MGNYTWIGRSWQFLCRIWATVGERNLGLIAAGVAFFGMFAIFPALAALIAVFGLLADPAIVSEQLNLLREVIPPEVFNILAAQIDRLLGAQSNTLGWATVLSIVLALWAARAGVAALMSGLNAIADMPSRNGFKQAFVAYNLTIGLVCLAILALLAVVISPIVLAFAPIASGSAMVLEGIRWVVALGALYAALAFLYRFGPNQRGARIKWFTIGAGIVVFVWIGASFGLSFYLTNFASYNEVYGSIGAVIGMLLWLYITAYLVLLGAVLNLHVHGKVSGPDKTTAKTEVTTRN